MWRHGESSGERDAVVKGMQWRHGESSGERDAVVKGKQCEGTRGVASGWHNRSSSLVGNEIGSGTRLMEARKNLLHIDASQS